MDKLLNFYADAIEGTLAAHGVQAQVVGGRVHPRFITFEAITLIGQKVGDIERRSEEIALALNAPSVRIARQRGCIVIEVPRDDARPVRLLSLLDRLDGRPPFTAVLGLADNGSPLLLNLNSPDTPHALIAGVTGCGKTELLRTVALSLAMNSPTPDLGLLLVGQRLAMLAELPHLVGGGVIEGPEAALGVLASLVGEMEARLAADRRRPLIVAVIDELADLLMAGGQELEIALTRLTQRGRNAGIHVVAATQKPTAAVIGSLVKANFPVRIVGSVASPEDAKVAAGLAGTGAERLLGRGDFLVVSKGQVTRFQAAYIPPGELAAAVARVDPSTRFRQAQPDGSRRGGKGMVARLPEMPKQDWREWVKSRLRIVNGRGGHNRQPPTEEMVTYALEVRRLTGDWPSKRAIRAQFGCNNRRATATLAVATERWNGKTESAIGATGSDATSLFAVPPYQERGGA